ncbi:MAG: alpha/beta hydrolase-fold protein [Actinomycetota bacterium]|nr:alpha/beta hydrolase-fold protein [Actinomycetota bacterium]
MSAPARPARPRPSPSAGPVVDDAAVHFRLADPGAAFAAVGLVQDIRRPRDWTPLDKVEGSDTWTLAFPRPDVDRMEYRFKGVHRDGGDETFCDPANPLRAPGAFGDKSVVEFPGYPRPAWLGDDRLGGDVFAAVVPSRALRADVTVRVWSSRGAGEEEALPLLVAHDGSEYAAYSRLLRLLDRMTTEGRLPPMRAALLDPVERDDHYSASAAYARAMAVDVLPALEWLAPTPPGRHARVGMGASLGALAMLHLHWTRPDSFGALFLQSGSYFRQRYDRHESGFPRFRRISRLVAEILAAASARRPVPTVMTCGTVEENLANNRAVAAALERLGYDVRLHVNRDAHNFVAWRDTFHPHLVDLLAAVWR